MKRRAPTAAAEGFPPTAGRRAAALLCLAALAALPGCGKQFWRQNADAEAYGLSYEKSLDPRWTPPRLDVIPDPRSRFYDPYHPDCEPVPADDPAANVYMNRMGDFGRIRGDDDWHEEYGYTPFIENPNWLARFPVIRRGFERDGLAGRVLSGRTLREAWAKRKAAGGVVPAAYQEDADVDVDADAGRATVPLDAPPVTPTAPPNVPVETADDGPADAGGPEPLSDEIDLRISPDPEEFADLPPTEDLGGADLDSGNPLLPPVYGLTLREAIELSYLHSRDYQFQIESVYLSALALAFERFRFDVRFLGFGTTPGFDFSDEVLPSGTDTATLGSRFGVSRLLPAGGQWIVELTNSTLWLFGGGGPANATASALSYSITQPLLRGAGRKVNLEALTQTERNLLYTIRDLARFRKLFFVQAVTDAPGGGFLGLLNQVQLIENQRDNIRRLEEQLQLQRELSARTLDTYTERVELPPAVLDRLVPVENAPTLRDFPGVLRGVVRYNTRLSLLQAIDDLSPAAEEALLAFADGLPEDAARVYAAAAADLIGQIRIEPITLDVAQLESQLARNVTSLRRSEASLQDSLDQYKFFLGLPPDMVLTLDDSFLEPFRLIDDRLARFEGEVNEFVREWAGLNLVGGPEENERAAAAIPAAEIADVLDGLDDLNDRIREEAVGLVTADLAAVTAIRERRLGELNPVQRARFSTEFDRNRRELGNVRRALDDIAGLIDRMRTDIAADDVTAARKAAIADAIAVTRQRLLLITRGLQVIETSLRVELPTLNPFDLDQERAVALGVENRLDLMNQRAITVDARRQLELTANALQAVLNLRAQGDVQTRPLFSNDRENPLDFRADQSSFRFGVRFDTPLDRVAERNAYRASQIDYQRARRDYIAAEDQVKIQIRRAWRQLAVLKENYEVVRQQVRIAGIQYDQTVEEQFAPAQVGGGRDSGRQSLNILNALSSLLSAQNSLISTWVDYESNRLAIHRDMGLMVISADGVWLDPFYLRGDLRIVPPTPDAGIPDPDAPDADAPDGLATVPSFDPAAVFGDARPFLSERGTPRIGPPGGAVMIPRLPAAARSRIMTGSDATPAAAAEAASRPVTIAETLGLIDLSDPPEPVLPAGRRTVPPRVGSRRRPVAAARPARPARAPPRAPTRAAPMTAANPHEQTPGPDRSPTAGGRPGAGEARRPRRGLWLLGGLAVAGAATVILWPSLFDSFARGEVDNSRFVVQPAKRGLFRVTVREKGELDSLESVVLSNQTGETTTIVSIVPEGTLVKEGDLVIELDAVPVEEEYREQQVKLTKARADLEKAEQNLEIVRQQNESDIAAAQLAKELAALDLEKYRDGDYPQEVKTLEDEIAVAEEDLIRKQEDYEFSKRMAKKGYKSLTEMEADRIAVSQAEITRNSAQQKLKVLEQYERKRQIAELQENERETVRQLERIKAQTAAALAQAEADVKATTLTFEVEALRTERTGTATGGHQDLRPQRGRGGLHLRREPPRAGDHGGEGGQRVFPAGPDQTAGPLADQGGRQHPRVADQPGVDRPAGGGAGGRLRGPRVPGLGDLREQRAGAGQLVPPGPQGVRRHGRAGPAGAGRPEAQAGADLRDRDPRRAAARRAARADPERGQRGRRAVRVRAGPRRRGAAGGPHRRHERHRRGDRLRPGGGGPGGDEPPQPLRRGTGRARNPARGGPPGPRRRRRRGGRGRQRGRRGRGRAGSPRGCRPRRPRREAGERRRVRRRPPRRRSGRRRSGRRWTTRRWTGRRRPLTSPTPLAAPRRNRSRGVPPTRIRP